MPRRPEGCKPGDAGERPRYPRPPTMAKVAVLVSGGVDSSVALCRLADSGEHELTAFYVRIWLEDELAFLGSCPWEEDLAQVRRVCELTGTPLEIVSLQREYHREVVAASLEELRAGRTPSPDVLCNRRIKFGAFVDRAGPGFDLVASGHYARTRRRADGRVELLRGLDPVKDQTYFLCRLDQRQVARSLFPIGGSSKAEVRAEARRRGLPNADRPDSQGICFLGRVPYEEFVRFHLGDRPGEIREAGSERLLGAHRGAWFHTVGQRRGLGLSAGPWYVVAKDVAANTVWVCHRDRLELHARGLFRVPDPRWIVEEPPAGRCQVRLRHGPASPWCRVSPADGALEVELDRPDPGVAPGQYAVFYEGEVCLGGGTIG